jgi:hypothetical protein
MTEPRRKGAFPIPSVAGKAAVRIENRGSVC